MRRIAPVTIFWGVALGMLLSMRLHAADAGTCEEKAGGKPDISVSITTGVRILPNLMWGFIPMPPSTALTIDVYRIRIRTDVSYHPFADSVHATLGAGAVFVPLGKRAPSDGGFQIKLPVLLDVGCVAGTVDAGDGYNDEIFWMLLGPSVGGDFTWWKAEKVGFSISVKLGYQFRFDIDSEYADGYSSAMDTIGLADISVLLGVTL